MSSGTIGTLLDGRTGTTHTECRHCGTNLDDGRAECTNCGHGAVVSYEIY